MVTVIFSIPFATFIFVLLLFVCVLAYSPIPTHSFAMQLYFFVLSFAYGYDDRFTGLIFLVVVMLPFTSITLPKNLLYCQTIYITHACQNCFAESKRT